MQNVTAMSSEETEKLEIFRNCKNPPHLMIERKLGPSFTMSENWGCWCQLCWSPDENASLHSIPEEGLKVLSKLEDYWKNFLEVDRVSVILSGFLVSINGHFRYLIESMQLTVFGPPIVPKTHFQKAGFLVTKLSQNFLSKYQVCLGLNIELERLQQNVGMLPAPEISELDDMCFANLMKEKTTRLTKLSETADGFFGHMRIFEGPDNDVCEKWLNNTFITTVLENRPFLYASRYTANEIDFHRCSLSLLSPQINEKP